jgi:hypothetical protein
MSKFNKGDIIISSNGLYAIYDSVKSEDNPVVIYAAIYDILSNKIKIGKDTGIRMESDCQLAGQLSEGKRRFIKLLKEMNTKESNSVLTEYNLK